MSQALRAGMEPAITAARRYCALLEESATTDADALREGVEDALLTVLYEVRRLPLVEPATDGLVADLAPEVAERYRGIHLTRLFPSWKSDGLWASDRPLSSVEDDLRDVWRDLMPLVVAFDDPAVPVADIAWELRHGYDSHWGPHALAALPVIHRMQRY